MHDSLDDVTYYVGMRRSSIVRIARVAPLAGKAFAFMQRNSVHVSDFFRLPADAVVEIGRRFQSEQSPAATEQGGLICCSHSPAPPASSSIPAAGNAEARLRIRALLRRPASMPMDVRAP